MSPAVARMRLTRRWSGSAFLWNDEPLWGIDERPSRGFEEYLSMKSRDNNLRLKQFQANEKRRQLMQLDMMVAEFARMAGELDAQIAAEEKKAGINDINHFAYPTFAKAARQRRDNLKDSQNDLAQQRQAAQAA